MVLVSLFYLVLFGSRWTFLRNLLHLMCGRAGGWMGVFFFQLTLIITEKKTFKSVGKIFHFNKIFFINDFEIRIFCTSEDFLYKWFLNNTNRIFKLIGKIFHFNRIFFINDFYIRLTGKNNDVYVFSQQDSRRMPSHALWSSTFVF